MAVRITGASVSGDVRGKGALEHHHDVLVVGAGQAGLGTAD
jgi:hypothetical protein